MVPPGQADEITIVVSTLAKAYAQRLVTAARRVAAAEGADESTPLTPDQVMKAYHSRVQAGLDPGFFLRKPKVSNAVAESSAAVAAALGTVDTYALQRSAALAAQEEYDNYIKSKEDSMDVDETGTAKENKEEGADDNGKSSKKDEESAKKEKGAKDVQMKEADETSTGDKKEEEKPVSTLPSED